MKACETLLLRSQCGGGRGKEGEVERGGTIQEMGERLLEYRYSTEFSKGTF